MARLNQRALAGLLPLAIAASLMLAAVPAKAGVYVSYSYGHHGYGHGYGFRYGHGHGYRPFYRPRGYGFHGYGFRPHYRPHYAYRSYGTYHGGLLHGLLSVPGAMVGALLGHRHYRDSTASASSVTTTTTPTAAAADRGGWASLADGHYARALAAFADETSSQPNQGRPKVGYALAAAAGGDLVRGVWAMRRALRVDPDAMHYVTVDGALRLRIEQLIASYIENPDDAIDDAEATFMLASLYYLLREPESARIAFRVALGGGASPPSTVNLGRIIERDLAGAEARAPALEDGD